MSTNDQMPPLPAPAAYGFKSMYGFDPRDKHKGLIGVSLQPGGSHMVGVQVKLFTADQMWRFADQTAADQSKRIAELEELVRKLHEDARATHMSIERREAEFRDALAARQPVEAEPVARVLRIVSESGIAEVAVYREVVLKIGAPLYAAPPPSTVKGEVTDEEIIEVVARVASHSLNITRLHELRGKTSTIMDEAGVIEFARALLSQQGTKGGEHG